MDKVEKLRDYYNGTQNRVVYEFDDNFEGYRVYDPQGRMVLEVTNRELLDKKDSLK